MYIKEICLEGFKSYATRTVVPGFDPFFNAITGLNGSGKSNILDSICFVLGITNLSNVRVGSLQELVYKQGQAGITRATVSIVFDNSDRNRSPIGYEDCPEITVTRQLVVGPRSTYKINGHPAQPSRVQTLFHSVQLNVNNPHFLIMQGRITKVLNMKPPEILSMLEEAAGTRMYEMKKISALKTLEKKQNKVDEINKLLDEEILPALEKLRKEKTQYVQWANGNQELDRLRRFCAAFEFVQAERVRDSALSEVTKIKDKMEELDVSMEKMKEEINEKDKSIAEKTAEKEATMGGELKELSKNFDELEKSLVKEKSVMENQEELLNNERIIAQKILKNIEDTKTSILQKEADVTKAENEAADQKQKVEDLTKKLEEHEKEFQGVLAGKSSGNEEKCLEDQLRDEKAAAGEAKSQLEQLQAKIYHSENELKAKKAQWASKQDEATAAQQEFVERIKELEVIKASMDSINYKEGDMEAMQKERSILLAAVQELKDKVRVLSGGLASVNFSYHDPVKNFDRSKVKGVFAKLFQVKDSSTATALEVAAGGNLYFVVVDSEDTGKMLIKNGNLARRTTFIPLNKISTYLIPQNVQKKAAELVGREYVKLAFDLVRYGGEVKNAVAHVFGSTFVCWSSDFANKVAFDPEIRFTCVSLEGDKFVPSGYLTGGSRRGGGELLQKLGALATAEKDLADNERRLAEIEARISELLVPHRKYNDLKKKLELKSYDLELFKSRVEQNEHHKLGELVKKLEEELEAAKQEEKEKQGNYDNCASSIKKLEKLIKDHGSQRETRLKDLDKKIKSIKNEMQSASKALKEHASKIERLIMEKDAVVSELSALDEQLAASQSQIKSLSETLEKHKGKVNLIKKQFEEAKEKLQVGRKMLQECDSQLNLMNREQQKLQHKLSDINVERKKLENEVKRMEIEQKDCSSKVDKMREKYSWIAAEKHLFGKSGTDYDFASCDPRKAREELESLQEEQSNLEKRVNKKVMAMFEKAEDEYNDLKSKKSIIENDKAKISKVIEELDEKKKETLKVTWVKVNKDFGSIFSTLLPGTMAKLEPPEGGTFLDGLEVRVAFGSVWKQSLSELSGGQRSLLALSLILALLLFKPAPLYILDEVDAALDLSHTQNIGRMIKAHFPHSQFIVVSLKEGMFNNANVIFRTKFVDGVSTVARTVPSKQK
ncbi:Structural maintenance of chromosomes protein [Rhynchospora pubera]|uniref:Structural maintenance of chromosomes protein n=1 Tax=Rhynchospora pubera TaxID=906938 RepID=A0AAV8EBH1_9POAL|nr:Structural maintenance of chromosomes protein [Rhynchospora pubera]